jgi:two-component system response regulator FixJ
MCCGAGPFDASVLTERLQLLTSREHEARYLALNGHSCKVIAHELGISHRTVEPHRSNLLEKLGVGSITELLLLKLNSDAQRRL